MNTEVIKLLGIIFTTLFTYAFLYHEIRAIILMILTVKKGETYIDKGFYFRILLLSISVVLAYATLRMF